MPTYLILAAMKGKFVSDHGNTYDNFQMMGYVEAGANATTTEVVGAFFDQPPYPIQWQDVEYLWAERLGDNPDTGHYGDYDRVYIETLRERWEGKRGDSIYP